MLQLLNFEGLDVNFVSREGLLPFAFLRLACFGAALCSLCGLFVSTIFSYTRCASCLFLALHSPLLSVVLQCLVSCSFDSVLMWGDGANHTIFEVEASENCDLQAPGVGDRLQTVTSPLDPTLLTEHGTLI